jgi:hypothetical protein
VHESAEEDCKHDSHQDWLKQNPGSPNNRLLVTDLEVTPDQEIEEFAMLPQFAQVDRFPEFCRADGST